MSDIWKSPCGRMELRLGRWQDVLADVTECDAVITDPPYSERTHKGQRSDIRYASKINYTAMDAVQTRELWTFAERGVWCVAFGDHTTAAEHRRAAELGGWYVFAPVIWAKPDATPRFSGDGPASAVEHLTIGRCRADRNGSRPGYYISCQVGRGSNGPVAVIGEKPIGMMRKIVTDYCAAGGLVIDCYAGSGTTLLAAAIEGRRAIGAECDEETYRKAVKRLSAGYTPVMTFDRKPKQKQEGLF